MRKDIFCNIVNTINVNDAGANSSDGAAASVATSATACAITILKVINSILPGLSWCDRAIWHSVNRIKQDSYHLKIFSDASTTGWGVALGEQRANGLWSAEEGTQHIKSNCLRFLVCKYSPKT